MSRALKNGIEEPTIATLLALYSGAIPKTKAQLLVDLLKDKKAFATEWPVPSVPRSSTFFNPFKYWQGPSWINTNWLIIKGLENYGFNDDAAKLRDRTLELVARGGMNEYFNPLTGQAVGAPTFSWTAALTIDLLNV